MKRIAALLIVALIVSVGLVFGASIRLNWDRPEDNLAYINVYESHELEGPWGLVGATYEEGLAWICNQDGRWVRDYTTATFADPYTSYTVTGVEINTPHYYRILSVDYSGNESELSNIASAVVVDSTPPDTLNLSIIVRDSSGVDRELRILVHPELITEAATETNE